MKKVFGKKYQFEKTFPVKNKNPEKLFRLKIKIRKNFAG